MILIPLMLTLVLIVLYLAIGLAIYAIGTRKPAPHTFRLERQAENTLAFKEEPFFIDLKVNDLQLSEPPEKEEVWDIALAIDCSESMGHQSALKHAREAAKNLIATTPADFCFALVQFRETASISAQFTKDRNKLNKAIAKLLPDGATAIDEGLKMALALFESREKNDRKKAVVLLSDGDSDQTAALQQANAMKEAGIALYAIGLGDCRQDFMKQMAQLNNRFFYAKEPAQLKKFLFQVGRHIQKNTAGDIEITEYPALDKNPFVISGWDKIPPLDVHITPGKQPYIKWFLTGLNKESARVRYRVKPLCCGWYPVTGQPARLALKKNDQEESYPSGRSQYVLVIPRFRYWQFLWIFLNPLFWIIRKRFFKKNSCLSESKPPELLNYLKPQPMPMEQIQTLTPIEKEYKLQLKPTLAIGIGYGGTHAVTHFKRLLWEHDDDEAVERSIAFVAVDSVNSFFREPVRIGVTHLDLRQRIHLHQSTSEIIDGEAAKNYEAKEYCWLDAEGLNARGTHYDAGKGTSMNPKIGRLIYRLSSGVAPGLTPILQQLHRDADNQPVEICLLATMGGGTATGMIFDIAHQVKQLARELDIPHISISLFLMDAPPDEEENNRDIKMEIYQSNKKALFMQLGRFHAARDIPVATVPGGIKISRWFDRFFYIEKKDNTRNKSDLYPQAAVLLYQWIVDKHLKEQVLKEGDCNGDGLSMHRFRTNVVFYYKRLMEYYFAYRLLLTVIGNRILGLGKNPPNFTTRHAEIEDLDVNKTFNLLLEKEEWKPSRPLLLRYSRLIRTPDGNLLTHLLNRGELAAFASASESPLQDGFLENETQAFKDLVVAWLQFLMNSHNNPDAQPTKDKKLPITYRALSKLKENLAGIKDLAEGISSTENLLDRRQCLLISQLCFNYIEYIDSWLREFNHWFVRLGEGTKEYHGICRYLNIQLNDWDIAIQASGQFLTTPSFTFTPAIKKHIYHTYFHDLENHIVDRLHWSIRQEGKLALKIAGPELVEFISESGQQMTDEILKQLLDLPGYYAATLNRWHKMTIRDYIRLVKDTGIDIVKQTLVPPLADTTRHDLLFTGQASYDTLEPHVPNGIASDTLQAQNPYIYGFHKCRINHPQKENREINFDALPPFIFAEEWNCYHALTVYRQVTGIEAAVPTYPVVALCRDMKKLLAAVNLGIMEQRIRTQQQSQMIYTFANLVNVPQTTHKENDIFKLIARVIQSDDPAVLQELDMAYRRILLLKAADIKEPLMDSPLPISTQTKKQLYQVVAGGTEFFRNLEMQTSLS